MNEWTHRLLGFHPTPGGTGWQVDLERLIQYILWQCVRQGGDKSKLPDTLELRITYDGAEVGDHPGIIAYVVPMNLDLPVQAATSAYPLAFTRCQENGANLQAEFTTICESITNTSTAGITHEGRHYKCMWYQSMDLASFWKQCKSEDGKGITFNCNIGYCKYCKCNHKSHHKFEEWQKQTLDTAFHITTLLPIPKSRTIICVLHAKLRITEKLLTLLACDAVELDKKNELLQACVEAGIRNLRINTPDDTHKKLSISTLYGKPCDSAIEKAANLVAASGLSNYKRIAANEQAFGPADLHKKDTKHLQRWLTEKGATYPKGAKKEQLQKLYLQHTNNQPATPHHQLQQKPGHNHTSTYFCPIHLLEYTYTGRLTKTQEIWQVWGEVNGYLRRLEPLSTVELELARQKIDRFGELFLDLYTESNVTCYIHIICSHAHALLKLHGSLGAYANQGVEAAHKLIRQKLNFTQRGGGKWYKHVTLAVLERHYRVDILRSTFSVADLKTSKLAVVEMDADGNESKATARTALGQAFSNLIESLGTADVSMHTFVHTPDTAPADSTAIKKRKAAVTGTALKKLKADLSAEENPCTPSQHEPMEGCLHPAQAHPTTP